MFFPLVRPGLTVAAVLTLTILGRAADGPAAHRHPGAGAPVDGLVLLGMALPRKRRRRRVKEQGAFEAARFHALFDSTPVQILEEDFTAVEKTCGKLRAQGVTNIVAHLIQHPALARELRGQVRLRDANRPAVAAAGFVSRAEMIARFPALTAAPYPEVFENQVEALWYRRRLDEEEFRYLDAEGRERACLMLQKIRERNGQPDFSRVVLVLLDLSTARRTVEAQMENQEVLRQILARANILLWWARVHREGEQLRWKINVPSQAYDSPLFRLATARDRGGLWDAEHVPDLPEASSRAEAALRGGQPGYQQEFQVLGPDGTHWVSEDVAIRRLGEDEWNLVGVITDVTARHRAEEAHRTTETQLAQILTRADCMLWHANVVRDGDELRWHNFTMPASVLSERLFGVSPVATGRDLWYATDTPDLTEMNRRSREAILSGAHGYEQEFSVIRRDRTLWLHEQVSITRAGAGEWNLVGVLMDVTARHEAEEARQASEARFRALFENAAEGVYQSTPEGRFLGVNPSMARIFGCATPAEFIAWVGDGAGSLYVRPGRREEFFVELGDYDRVIGFESEVRTRDGTIRWISETTRVVRGPDGRVLVMEGFVTDVTERHQTLAALQASEAQIREILERADCLLWRSRLRLEDGHLRWLDFDMPPSGLSARLFGSLKVTAEGKLRLWALLNVPELPEMNERNRQAVLSGAPDYEQDFRVIKPEGTIWLHEHVSIIPAGPNEWRLVGVLMDVTARREAEEARKASDAQLRQILQRADCLMWQARVVRLGDQLQWVRFAVPESVLHQRIFGTARHASEDQLWTLVNVPEREEMNARSRAAVLGGAPGYEHEFRVVDPAGTRWLLERVSITRQGPDEWAAVGVVVDVTDRRQAEEARSKAEAQLQQILTQADCLLWQARVIENAAGLLDWHLYIPRSSLYRQLFGKEPSEHSGLMWSELSVPEAGEMHQRSLDAIRGGMPGYEQEFRARHDGQWRWLHEQVTITPVKPGEWNLVGVITEFTARRVAEMALAEEKERLAVTLRAMTEGVVTTDTKGLVQYINRAAMELIGCDEAAVIGRPVNEVCVLHEGRASSKTTVPFARVAQENSLVDLPLRTNLTSRDGTVRQVEGCCIPIHAADSALIGTVLVFRDVTEREHLEQELARASKLESIGILAGGIAHDFNNILTVIMGNLTLAQLDAGDLAKVEYYLRETERAALRARDLTQQLLTFAKGGDPIRTAVRLPEIITEVAQFALHGSRVKCEFDFAPDLWPADADKGQLGQVVQNLVINSMQAMPEGGVIRIRARNDSPTQTSQAPFIPGDYVRISVTDTGTGIKSEHLDKIFDPYFTTKQLGSGLGLATVYSIVKKHHGDIEVESELGRGTTFHIWLPAQREVQLSLPENRTEVGAPMKGRVLLMDDEQTIREMAAFLLKRLGFEVELAADGAEAIEKYRAAHGTGQAFDLVVMDLTVPGGMGGQEAVERLKQLDPEVRAVVSSGYSSDPVLANYQKYGFRGMVAKPYQLDDLIRVLRDVLGSRRPPG